MTKFKTYFTKIFLGLLTLILGAFFIRQSIFPRWLDSSIFGSFIIFFLSTGDFIDPDHEYLFQPDSLEGITLFGTAHYLREVNEPEWSYASVGGLFHTIEESTPAGLLKLGWDGNESDKFNAAFLWTSEVVLPPILILEEADEIILEKHGAAFHKPKFSMGKHGEIQIEAWLKYEDQSGGRHHYGKERFIYDTHGNLTEREVISLD